MIRRGFSLIEVLVAIALLLVLVGALYSFLFNMLDARRRALDVSGRQRAAMVLIDRLEGDLLTSLVGDARVGAGVAGGDEQIRVLSRSVPAHLAEEPGAAAFGDLLASTYAFEPGRGLTFDRSVGGSRRRGDAAAVGEGVFRVRFRYHDGASWVDAFDSLEAGRLPAAVEVAVWFDPWPGERPEPAAEDPEDDAEEDPFLDAGFDEDAFARTSDLETFDEPLPDRIRVIVIPDAVEAAEAAASSAADPDDASEEAGP